MGPGMREGWIGDDTAALAHEYIERDNPSFEAQLEERTAAVDAAFLLPHLRAGSRVLDVGCGPGSITLGLAQAASPGEVVGVDLQQRVVERARVLAADRGISNVRFEVADAYELPFADGTFDAVLEHRVLMHLSDPVRGLREVRRVLRAGGVLGLRDVDVATAVRWPTTPKFELFHDLRMRAFALQGIDGRTGRKHRQLLLEAGFERAETRAVTEGGGSPAGVREHARFLLNTFEGIARIALEQGWVDQAGADAIAADIRVWAERPDAVAFMVICETLGWVRA
jgi:ubiquinone/menaquinone biosynthesis C-methylase UbiE